MKDAYALVRAASRCWPGWIGWPRAEVAGRRVLVVEDVVTSGGQVVASGRRLRELGARIEDALA
jgi:hypothetical protein